MFRPRFNCSSFGRYCFGLLYLKYEIEGFHLGIRETTISMAIHLFFKVEVMKASWDIHSVRFKLDSFRSCFSYSAVFSGFTKVVKARFWFKRADLRSLSSRKRKKISTT